MNYKIYYKGLEKNEVNNMTEENNEMMDLLKELVSRIEKIGQ